MKRNVFILLALLLFATVSIAGPLHSSVIDDATTYIDIGYQADNVTVVAKVEVINDVFISTATLFIAEEVASVESGIMVYHQVYLEPGWVRQDARTHYSTNKKVEKNATDLFRSPRDGLTNV